MQYFLHNFESGDFDSKARDVFEVCLCLTKNIKTNISNKLIETHVKWPAHQPKHKISTISLFSVKFKHVSELSSNSI